MLTEAQRTALTARLRQNRSGPAAAAAGPVVPLGREGAPAFAVHAVSGTVHEYGALARELDGAYRVSGIEAARGAPVADLAVLADRYAGLVRGAHPAGPYRLIGWSMGGVLAYETARRLAAAGGEVALVTLIDAPYRAVARYADSAEGLAALFVAEALRTAGHEPAAPEPTAPVAHQLAHLAERLADDPSERAALAAELTRRHATFAAHTTALAGYRPTGPLDAAAVLVHAAGSPDSTADWARLFGGGARCLHVAAGHYDCLRPPTVVLIAEAVRAAPTPRSTP
ncbi:thioesterase domain-containing protein [Actinoplanes sp. NPDC049599]|uniref:thioesterase domain-containing protein n=1 Tax=Actinoplanes sp. NPDC049599 TaxID=3363903 RepID=UPI0037B6B0CE